MRFSFVGIAWGCWLIICASHSLSAEATRSTYCGRAEASRTCPVPPTFDSLHIASYVGGWFQIGAGAQFSFVSEPGLVCGRALYTLPPASNTVTVRNSGIIVLSPAGLADIARVGTASSRICSGARAVCYNTAPANSSIHSAILRILQVASKWKKLHPTKASSLSKISRHLSLYVKTARLGVEAAAQEVSSLQLLLNQASQANASLSDTINSIKDHTRRLRKQELAALDITVMSFHQTQTQLLALKKSMEAAEKEDKALREAAEWISSTAQLINSSVIDMKKAAVAAEEAATSLLLSGKPVEKGSTFQIIGKAVQVNASLSAGKLEVSFNGEASPYWVLAIEGDYRAALVYSCTAGRWSGQLDKSLFILSRTPSLSSSVIARFLSLANSYGIYSDCDDPFLFTVQKGGTCGLP